MATSFGIRIDKLRKRSRALLSSLEENARVVDSQVKKLRLRNSSPVVLANGRSLISQRNSELWKLRNDSSGVGAALCPDYFRPTPRYKSHSVPDMNYENGKLLMKSTKRQPKPAPPRKPVKECYCNPEVRKVQYRSLRTKHRPMGPCNHSCRSHSRLAADHSSDVWEEEDGSNLLRSQSNVFRDEGSPQSPALSTETVKRAQRINYTPRSQFLRNLKGKVSGLHRGSVESPSEPSPRSPSPSFKRYNFSGDYSRGNSVSWPQNSVCVGSKGFEERERAGGSRENFCPCSAREVQVPLQKTYKSKRDPKKTLSSKKLVAEPLKDNRPVLRSPQRNKRIVRIINKDCRCGITKESGQRTKSPLDKVHGKPKKTGPDYCAPTGWELEHFEVDKDHIGDPEEDEKINDMHKFREKNYFDTHGSDQTLLSSKSSGSLHQFRLNERLFPESVGKVHRENLVLSMPTCATKQRKSIHYFPKGLVKQEKNLCNTNYETKRRCQSCPLTGHAVDLGVLRCCHPSNSLALRYQKGVP